MSVWTSIRGTIEVNPLGRTQAEKRYVLETVLAHLPVITGSEADMQIYIVQPIGFDRSSNVDEFGYRTNNLVNNYGKKDRLYGRHQLKGRYILVLDADLRDREFGDTYRQLQKWLCRLAKRIYISRVMVEIESFNKGIIIKNIEDCYSKMFEFENGWYEYLLWNKEV